MGYMYRQSPTQVFEKNLELPDDLYIDKDCLQSQACVDITIDNQQYLHQKGERQDPTYDQTEELPFQSPWQISNLGHKEPDRLNEESER